MNVRRTANGLLAVAVAGVIGVTQTALAAELTCSGTVVSLSYHASGGSTGGSLMLRLSSMNVPVFICNPEGLWTVTGTSYTTPPATCKAIYATLLAARVSGTPLNSVYFDGDQVPASCNAWASWSVANIRHYHL